MFRICLVDWVEGISKVSNELNEDTSKMNDAEVMDQVFLKASAIRQLFFNV
jgi:hypothetical protein